MVLVMIQRLLVGNNLKQPSSSLSIDEGARNGKNLTDESDHIKTDPIVFYAQGTRIFEHFLCFVFQ